MNLNLTKKYTSREGTPVIWKVDDGIFRHTYYRFCMECSFCNDACCSYGVDIDIENVNRLKKHAKGLEKLLGRPLEDCLYKRWYNDDEYPGGKYTRSRILNGACAFLDRAGRGCLIHRYCLDKGIDFHELKPLISTLFPVTFGYGVLTYASEVDDRDLICLDHNESLYSGARDDLRYYFGDELIKELDQFEKKYPLKKKKVKVERVGSAKRPLPMLAAR